MPSLTTTLLKLTPLLLFILAADPANAVGCFSGGRVITPEDAASAISTACHALAGNYNRGTTNTSCQEISDSSLYHIDFKITLKSFENDGVDTEFISAADCIAQNSKTAAGCVCGGIREWFSDDPQWSYRYAIWLFEYDPNPKGCPLYI